MATDLLHLCQMQPQPHPSDRPQSESESESAGSCVHLDFDSLHDLTGPVNQISSMVDLILKKHRGALGVEAEALFGYIKASARSLENLMAGLRCYARVIGEPVRRRICDTNVILAAALFSLQPAIQASGARVTHDPLPELYCDPNQMTYVFTGLIENAVKFHGDRPPQIRVSSAPHHDGWLLSVSDNGIGIGPDYRERIFSLFKRLHHDAYPGAGVGLAVIKRIVEMHEGRVWVESNQGPGTTFCLSFPKG